MLDNNEPQTTREIHTRRIIHIGGVLLVLGTGLSMVLADWMADAAMGVAVLGFIVALAGWQRS